MILTYRAADGSTKKLRMKAIPRSPDVTIGRGKDATIYIDDPKASRINSAIQYWDDIYIIRDVHSQNGTLVNGKKIDLAKLNVGDIITIGDTEISTFPDEGSKSAATIVQRA
jgi:pSer/pThr/pTyr-binding forkhead associated (FHA) protein